MNSIILKQGDRLEVEGVSLMVIATDNKRVRLSYDRQASLSKIYYPQADLKKVTITINKKVTTCRN